MKKIKVFCLILSIVLLSGCAAKTNIIVDTNKNVIEKTFIEVDKEFLDPIYSSSDEISHFYRNYLNQYGKNYKLKVKYSGELVKANLNSDSNLSKLNGVESILVKNIEKNGNSYKITFVDDLKDYLDPELEIDVDPAGLLEDLTINIQFFNRVEFTNADYSSDSSNTFTWTINKNNYKDKTIEFSLSEEKRYDIIIPYYLKKYIAFLILGVIIITGIISILMLVSKSKSVNKL